MPKGLGGKYHTAALIYQDETAQGRHLPLPFHFVGEVVLYYSEALY